MNITRLVPAAAFLALSVPVGSAAQGVVVDEGTFQITVDGKEAGTEEFTIRRAGIGQDASTIANAVVQLDMGEGHRELRPVLETLPPEGTARGYQLKVSGTESTELNMNLAGRRYVSILRSQVGEEEREFLARPDTRILESWVAHQYYFLRDYREGSKIFVIEPRTRRQIEMIVGRSTDETVHIAGTTSVPGRRITLTGGGEERVVWFDERGRVLRLEVPAHGYVAVRSDLVG